MKSRKKLLLLGFLVILNSGNVTRIIGKDDIRMVVFLSIFVFGAVAALFLREVIVAFKNR